MIKNIKIYDEYIMHIPTEINKYLTKICYRIQIKCNKILWWITGNS